MMVAAATHSYYRLPIPHRKIAKDNLASEADHFHFLPAGTGVAVGRLQGFQPGIGVSIRPSLPDSSNKIKQLIIAGAVAQATLEVVTVRGK